MEPTTKEKVLARIDQLIEKGHAVLRTHRPNPRNVIGFPPLDAGGFSEWKSGVDSFVVGLLGKQHVYYENFENVDDISSLNAKLADKGVYNRLVQKKIQVWADVRNNADYGEFAEYVAADVKDMLSGVEQFLLQYPN